MITGVKKQFRAAISWLPGWSQSSSRGSLLDRVDHEAYMAWKKLLFLEAYRSG